MFVASCFIDVASQIDNSVLLVDTTSFSLIQRGTIWLRMTLQFTVVVQVTRANHSRGNKSIALELDYLHRQW